MEKEAKRGSDFQSHCSRVRQTLPLRALPLTGYVSMGKSHNISVPYSPHWDMRLVSPAQGCREDEIRQLNWKHHFLFPAEPNSHFSFTFFLSFFFFGLTTWLAGSEFPCQGPNPCSLKWNLEFLTSGPPGNFSSFTFSQHLSPSQNRVFYSFIL